MNPKDYNGHVPDCPACQEQSADYRAGYDQAVLDLTYGLLKKMHDDLTATLAKIGGPAE